MSGNSSPVEYGHLLRDDRLGVINAMGAKRVRRPGRADGEVLVRHVGKNLRCDVDQTELPRTALRRRDQVN